MNYMKCPRWGKTMYPTALKAVRWHNGNLQQLPGNDRHVGHPYVCPDCHMFHITRQAKPPHPDVTYSDEARKRLRRKLSDETFVMRLTHKHEEHVVTEGNRTFTIIYDKEFETVAIASYKDKEYKPKKRRKHERR